MTLKNVAILQKTKGRESEVEKDLDLRVTVSK